MIYLFEQMFNTDKMPALFLSYHYTCCKMIKISSFQNTRTWTAEKSCNASRSGWQEKTITTYSEKRISKQNVLLELQLNAMRKGEWQKSRLNGYEKSGTEVKVYF
jgi:hypothetical protein